MDSHIAESPKYIPALDGVPQSPSSVFCWFTGATWQVVGSESRYFLFCRAT